MKIAYFINQYPKVSHSFIRREILALEKLGYSISRFALRSDKSELVDPLDLMEFEKTQYILSETFIQIAKDFFCTLINSPLKFLKTFAMAMKIGFHSEKGLLKNFIYLVESCVLLQWQKKYSIKHIHAHFGTNSTTVVMLAYLLGGASYSFTIHGPEEFDKPEFISLAEKVQYSRFVITISSYGRSQLFRWIKIEHWNKVKIVHCGLEDSFFINEQLKNHSSEKLVCVGRLCEQKGQLLLLEAIKNLRDDGINCTLILAGDGPMRKEVERRIIEYDLNDCVQITGWISSDEVKALLMDCKGLVLPSFAEGLPVVIMEAMALKKPVISTYVAGIPELVKDKETGWLIPAGDVDALEEALNILINASPIDLEKMGEIAFQRVKKEHHIDLEVQKIDKLLKTFSKV